MKFHFNWQLVTIKAEKLLKNKKVNEHNKTNIGER